MSKPRDEDGITEVVRDQVSKANPDAEVRTQVPITSLDGEDKGQIDLLWRYGDHYVALEAGFELKSTAKEAQARLGEWETDEGEMLDIKNAVAVQYPPTLKEAAEEGIASAGFTAKVSGQSASAEEEVQGTAELAGVLDDLTS